MVLFDLAVGVERHAYVVAVVVPVAVAEVHVVSVVEVAFVWQTDDCDLGWTSHLRHRTILNLCRMEMVMGTVVREPLALGSLFETLELIRLAPIVAIVEISQVDAGRTGMK